MENVLHKIGGVASAATLLTGSVMFATATSHLVTTEALAQPACDGAPCDMQWECGSKCVCNLHALTCFDNT